ncbi:FG-GAP repeat domain-containing protein [Streptomyces sp. AB3(2024)]|uniref:FG-GAP repeat domain-containing protein n=1 Tax=Streptomyces sp. AB3(2024) TaxID=3317321 RepID=UPI0035A2FDB3
MWLTTRTGIYNENLALLPGTDELWTVNERPGARTAAKTSWAAVPAFAGIVDRTAADFTGDRLPDTLGVEASTGRLWLYPGTAGGGLGNRVRIGTGWNAMSELAAPGDLNADGKPDLAAVGHDGTLWAYPGTGTLNGTATLGDRTSPGTNWDTMRQLVGADLDNDGKGDLSAVQAPATSTGTLYLYPGTGATAPGPRAQTGTNW